MKELSEEIVKLVLDFKADGDSVLNIERFVSSLINVRMKESGGDDYCKGFIVGSQQYKDLLVQTFTNCTQCNMTHAEFAKRIEDMQLPEPPKNQGLTNEH